MGRRALGAAFGAAAQAIFLVAGAAYAAEVPAEVQPAGLASTPPAVPAGDSDLSQVACARVSFRRRAVGRSGCFARWRNRPRAGRCDRHCRDPAKRRRRLRPHRHMAGEPKPAHPVVAAVRDKLKDPALRKGAAAADLAALEAFYGERSEPPIWITAMGFSARAQALIAEIQKAGDWGLPPDAFDLPPASHLPATTRGPGRRRDQTHARRPEICALCPRRARRAGAHQRSVRSEAERARSQGGVDRACRARRRPAPI